MRHRRGFTLFEVLISITIVVVLVATLASTISIAYKSKRSAEEAVENVRDVQTVGDIFVASLQCTLPPWLGSPAATQAVATQAAAAATQSSSSTIVGGIGAGGGNSSVTIDGNTVDSSTLPTHLVGPFYGQSDYISFFASGSESGAEVLGDVRWIEFMLATENQPDGLMSLIRKVQTNLLQDSFDVENPTDDGLEDQILINHVKSVRFQYSDVTGVWNDSWDSTVNNNELPYAVSMEITLAPLTEHGQDRVIHRVASIWTAAPAATSPADTQTDGTTGGITNGPNTGFGQ